MTPWRAIWEPPKNQPIYEWAADNIELTPRQPTAFLGPYRAERTPYVKGIFDALQDVEVSRVTVCKGAQTGLSLAMHVALVYKICNDPAPMLLVMPNSDLAQSCSESRIQPLILDCPAARAELTTCGDDFKKLQYGLRRCVVNLVGSNSAANLASRPIRDLYLDEVDKFPEQTGKEARAVNLAIERTKTFWDKKIFEISTPTTGEGYIWQAFIAGDQRKYFLPCHACGEMQELTFRQVKFDESLDIQASAEGAYYECTNSDCKAHWTNEHKASALARGEWRPTAKAKKAGHQSFHLSALYAPWVTWADAVQEFRATKDNPSEFQNFINSWLGEPWREEPKDNVSLSRIFEIRDELVFKRGTIPTKQNTICFATVDVQKRFFPWAIWASDGESLYMVDHGLYVRFEDVIEKTRAPLFNSNGKENFVKLIMLDTGFGERTMETYEYCFRYPNIVALKGDTGTQTTQTQPFKISPIYPRGTQKLNLVRIHPSFFKYRLLDSLNRTGKPIIYFHNEINMDFAEQITGEVLMEEMNEKTGVPRQYFKVVHTPQDFFDLAQYALAAVHMGRKDFAGLNIGTPQPEPPHAEQQAAPPEPGKPPAAPRVEKDVKKFIPPAPRRRRVLYGGGED